LFSKQFCEQQSLESVQASPLSAANEQVSKNPIPIVQYRPLQDSQVPLLQFAPPQHGWLSLQLEPTSWQSHTPP
jgi:hypothetical protein